MGEIKKFQQSRVFILAIYIIYVLGQIYLWVLYQGAYLGKK
jgi:hypothetical protein